MPILIVLCLFAPFPLWLIETLLPYPYLIEEIFKFFVVKYTPPKNNWHFPLILGIIFSLSETILYLINFFALGDFSNLPLRLITTTTLHVSLFSLQYYSRHSNFRYFTLILAVLIHYFYNYFVFKL
ncbi:MAG: hypothetical protein WC784_02030 [Candidatus Shapirobacteria bacterium]|jgi:hypothetical protein